MVVSAISSSKDAREVNFSTGSKTDSLMNNPISFSNPKKAKVDNEQDVKDKKAQAKGQAYGELMSEVKNYSSGKPVLKKFTEIMKSDIKELQGIVNSFMNEAGSLIYEKENLDKDDSKSEKRAKEIDEKIKQLKDEAKPKLDKIYCKIYALEEASSLLIAAYGQDKAENASTNNFMEELEKIFSSQNASAEDIKAKVDELLKESEDLHPEKKKDNGKNVASSQANVAAPIENPDKNIALNPEQNAKSDDKASLNMEKPKLSLVA